MSEPEAGNPVPRAAPSIGQPTVPTAPAVEYGTSHKGHLAPIRTFTSDLADAVREKGGSVVRVAIAEEEKHRKEYEEASITSTKNIIFTVLGILIVAGAIGFVGWTYYHKKTAATPDPTSSQTPTPALITNEHDESINTTGMQVPEMILAIQNIQNNPKIETGQVQNIILTEGLGAHMTTQRFLKLLSTHVPQTFSQALLPDFMVGTYRYNNYDDLFVIMHGTAHDYLLAGMLEWEPYLFNDMTPLFDIDTSGFTKAELQSVGFQDAVIANRDARAAVDANKKPLFFYSFLDTNTIVFATNPKTLAEVVRRF